MATPIISKMIGTSHNTGINPCTYPNEKSARLKNAEQAAVHWSNELTTANQLLLIEKNLQFIAQDKAANAQYDLKVLRADNPTIILKNQQKSLELASDSLTEIKNKTVIGAIEMIAISVSLCALTMTSMRLIASDLFSILISFKIPAMSLIASLVGASSLLGWNADRKASLITRMAQDNVKASQTAVNQCKIRCQDYENKLKQKIAEALSAQQELKNVTLRVNAATETVHQAEINLNKANKEMAIHTNKKLSNNTNTTFVHLRESTSQYDTHAENAKTTLQEEERPRNTPAYM